MEKYKNNINTQLFFIGLLSLLSVSGFESPICAQPQKSWQWVKQIGGDSWDISAGVACDSKNNLYVAGSFYNTLNCSSKKLKSSGSQDLFVAMFDEKGSLKELTNAGGTGNDIATCLCVTSDDNLVIGGVLSDSAIFNKTKAPGNGRRLFVAAMDPRAEFIWVNTIAITGDASLYMISTDQQGNIFVAGVFSGALEAKDQKVTSKGKKDIFLVRISKTGTTEKMYSFGSEEDDSPGSLSVDASGNVALSGVFGKSFETDGMEFITSPITTKTNAFIALFDRDFKARWTNILLGEDYLQIASMKHDTLGNLYVAGSFSSKFKIADTVLFSKGYTDAFLLKYRPDGKLEWGRGFGSWYYDYANHINVDNLGGAIISGSLGDTLVIDSLRVEPLSKDNSALVIQFSPRGEAIWADCISGTGRNFSDGSVIDEKGNLYFTGSFRNKFERGSDALTSFGDQDVFLAKYYNCPTAKAEISGQPSFCPGSGTELSVKRGFTNIVWNDSISGKNSILATKPGQYWIRMVDKKGCLLTDTIQVTQNNLPVFSLGNDTSILVTDSILLKVPAVFSRYQWHDFTYEPVYLAKSVDMEAGTSEYWLTVTDSLSCNYTDTITVEWLKGYDWIDPAKAQLITYPNPATDRVYWYLKTDEACQLVTELTDGNGRVLYHQYFKKYLPGEVKEVSLSNIPSGLYNIRVGNSASGKYYKTVRVIKQ